MQESNPVKRRVWSWTAYLALLLAAIVVGTAIYWLNQPEEVIHLNSPITIQPPEAPVESKVYVGLDYCKLQSADGIFSRRIVSDRQEIINQTGIPEHSKSGCVKSQQELLLPKQAEAGTYRIKYVINYQLNPLKSVMVTLISEPFTIK